MKALIFLGITIGGIAGVWLGGKFDNGFGLWSIIFGLFVGPLLGLYIGFKVGDSWIS